MKNTVLILFISVAFSINAQEINPFESIVKEGKILTLSKGKYTEVHINDSLQRIGSVIVNMNTGTIYELLNTDTLYSEATLDPTVISRFYSLDPAASKYPGDSPYMFAGNNPIFYIDEDGKWKVRFRDYNDHSAGIVLVAEPGDDLQTLSTQMGIPYQELVDNNFGGNDFTLNGPLEGGEWLRQEDLPGIDAFQAINDYLARKDIDETNCANCAFYVNGIVLPNAWEGDKSGVETMDQAQNILEKNLTNVSEKDSKIGDIITYNTIPDKIEESYSYLIANFMKKGKAFDEDGNYTSEFLDAANELSEELGVSHYSVVLLKSEDGNSVSFVFEKPGKTDAAISPYKDNDSFYAAPGREGDSSPIYRSKED